MRSGCTEAARKQSVANSFPAAAKQKGLNVDPTRWQIHGSTPLCRKR